MALLHSTIFYITVPWFYITFHCTIMAAALPPKSYIAALPLKSPTADETAVWKAFNFYFSLTETPQPPQPTNLTSPTHPPLLEGYTSPTPHPWKAMPASPTTRLYCKVQPLYLYPVMHFPLNTTSSVCSTLHYIIIKNHNSTSIYYTKFSKQI